MLEISRITFVLLLEGLALFVILTLLFAGMAIVRKRRRVRAVMQLAEQIRHQSSIRRDQTGSYLEAVYQLEDGDLHAAINNIDKQEKQFFQHLIDVIHNEDNERIASLDAALAELIDTYKNLRPRERVAVEQDPELLAETETLKQANESLRSELAITKETMSGMIAEFGNMFGGGANHELAKHEVVEKIIDQDNEVAAAEAKALPGQNELADAGETNLAQQSDAADSDDTNLAIDDEAADVMAEIADLDGVPAESVDKNTAA